jgi:hypothetical protein
MASKAAVHIDEAAVMHEFVASCGKFPIQYTPEWFTMSHVTIGGSDMESLRSDMGALTAKKIKQVDDERTGANVVAHAPAIPSQSTNPAVPDDVECTLAAERENAQPEIVLASGTVIDDDDVYVSPQCASAQGPAPAPAPAPVVSSRKPSRPGKRVACEYVVGIADDDDVYVAPSAPVLATELPPVSPIPKGSKRAELAELQGMARPVPLIASGLEAPRPSETQIAPSSDATIYRDPITHAIIEPRPNARPCAQPDAAAVAQVPLEPGKPKNVFDEVPMGWGTFFEPLLCSYIARRANLTIDGRAISYQAGPFRYSPDGLFVDHAGHAVLLEMKNPFMRVWRTWDTARNDQLIEPHLSQPHPEEVPPQYIGQLQLGLHLIECVSYAYYVEAIYRRANSYGRSAAIKMQGMAKVRDASTIESGVTGIYHRGPRLARRALHDFSSRDNDDLLCEVLTHLRDGENSYVPLYFASETDQTPFTSVGQLPDAFPACADASTPTNMHLFGYIPWNLIGVHSARVDRAPNYIGQDLISRATSVVADIHRRCDALPSVEKRTPSAACPSTPCAQDVSRPKP